MVGGWLGGWVECPINNASQLTAGANRRRLIERGRTSRGFGSGFGPAETGALISRDFAASGANTPRS